MSFSLVSLFSYSRLLIRCLLLAVALAVLPAQLGAMVQSTGTGLLGSYFPNVDLSGDPTVTRIDPLINFDWGSENPPATGLPHDHFSVRWVGEIETRFSEDYTLILRTDDGVRVWLDGVLVIDYWHLRSAGNSFYTFPATAGRRYGIRIEYFEGPQVAVAQMKWRSDSEPEMFIPTSQLYPPRQEQSLDVPAFHDLTYGASPVVLSATASSGLAPEYSVLSGPAILVGAQLTITGVGTVEVAADQPGNDTFAPAPQVTRSFVVTPATLTVTADSGTRAYGQTNQLFTGTLTGVVNGDAITATYVSSANAVTPAGVYGPSAAEAITPVLADPANRLANYTVTSENGTLTITAATQTIIWQAPIAITYGTPLSSEQLQATAQVAVAARIGTVRAAVPGSYVYDPPAGTILHAGANQVLSVTFFPDDSLNYAPVTSTVLLSVLPKSLIVRAEDKAMVAGGQVPTLTAVAEGLVAPDTLDGLETPAALTTTVTSNSPAGSYEIVVAGAADPDYDVTRVAGILVVSAQAGSATGSADCGCSSHPCGLGGGFATLALGGLLACIGGLRRRVA